MKKTELKLRTDTVIYNTCNALQVIFDSLNQGQKNKIIKESDVKALFDRYGVNYK